MIQGSFFKIRQIFVGLTIVNKKTNIENLVGDRTKSDSRQDTIVNGLNQLAMW